MVTSRKDYSGQDEHCTTLKYKRSKVGFRAWVLGTLRASLSGTFLQKKDVVNQCLECGSRSDRVVQPLVESVQRDGELSLIHI